MGIVYGSAAYRELGQMLRGVREGAGMTSTALARRVDWPLTRISRMELGHRRSSTVDVVIYLVGCGMTLQRAKPYLEFTTLAERDQGYYLSDLRIGGSLQSLIFHESMAENSVIYEPHLIHGLLQTPGYARARINAVELNISEERVAGAVSTRMERRQILYRPDAPRFTFYLHEQALRLAVGDDKTMHEQLLHLVLTTALENVTVRIVPSAAGPLGDGFRLMEFPEHRPIVYLDNLRIGGLILEDSDYVNSYYEFLPVLEDIALDEGQSRELAAELADAYDRGSQRGVAQEQLQQRRGDGLRGGGMADPPTAIYE
jgi:Domain of unknown function (DUF5753)/Helix-turn-helix domain